jgi:hypothetical protein
MCRISQYTLEASEPLVELITKPVPAVTVPILANRASFSSYFRGRGDSPFSSNHLSPAMSANPDCAILHSTSACGRNFPVVIAGACAGCGID